MEHLEQLIAGLQRQLDSLTAHPQPRTTHALVAEVSRLTYMIVGLETARTLLRPSD